MVKILLIYLITLKISLSDQIVLKLRIGLPIQHEHRGKPACRDDDNMSEFTLKPLGKDMVITPKSKIENLSLSKTEVFKKQRTDWMGPG